MAQTKKIYLDACIFVACFTREPQKIEKITAFFNESKKLDVEFYASDWTLTEIVKVLIKDKKISSKKVAEYVQELKRTKRMNEIKLNWVPVSTKEGYDFEEYFYDIQKIQLQYKGSLGDAVHALIMKNNSIKTILTTDSEFAGMKGMIVINPLSLNEN